VFQLPGNFQVNFLEAKGLRIMNMKCPVWDYEYPQHKVLHGFFPQALQGFCIECYKQCSPLSAGLWIHGTCRNKL
jgi:hypothetical protein